MTRYGAPESGQADDLVQFAPEDTARALDEGDCWRVLAVDDDEGFQRSTELALRNLRLLGRPLVLVQAYCLAEAARLLARDRDFAVVLADVVMETDDAGLRLVKGIREMLGLSEVRIILLTGQPGFAPIDEVMQSYDLSDYCLKSELAHRGLGNVLTAALRGYRDLRALSAARKGLQLILEASNRLSTARTIRDMSQEEQTIVVVPSISVDAELDGSLMQAYEERFLFLLLLLRQARAHVVYVTSQEVPADVVDYYVNLLPGVIASHGKRRLHMIAPRDGLS